MMKMNRNTPMKMKRKTKTYPVLGMSMFEIVTLVTIPGWTVTDCYVTNGTARVTYAPDPQAEEKEDAE